MTSLNAGKFFFFALFIRALSGAGRLKMQVGQRYKVKLGSQWSLIENSELCVNREIKKSRLLWI